MSQLMRCIYCGLLQDEPAGVKECQRCGGELSFEQASGLLSGGSYLQAQLELDQVQAPAGRNVDRYLLATLRTPIEVPPEQAAPTLTGRPGLNFTIVLDVSGSMQGEKLIQAKQAVQQSVRYLHESDIFSLVLFSSEVKCILEPTVVVPGLYRKIDSLLNEVQASGMTALCGGIELGIEKALRKTLISNLVLMLSDGQANVGETDLEKVGQRAWKGRQKGLVLSTIGVGLDYNEALMAEISNQGGGRFYHIQDPAQIPAYLTGELGEAATVSARKTVIELDLPAGAALIPLSSAFPAELTNGKVRVLVGDIPADLELEIPLRLTLYAQPEGSRLSIEGRVHYLSPAGNSLSSILNRVTVRFVPADIFQLRQGVALPVAEKVMQHMRSTYVLDISRAAAKSPQVAMQLADQEKTILRDYANLLGDESMIQLDHDLANSLNFSAASPMQAKVRVSDAAAFMRKARKFDK